MPLQNRVDPFGTIHAVPQRGTMMGNRGGRIHDPATRKITRHHASRRWIACVCEFKNRRLEVMGRGYTQLFFLDEVTAFAAGHRPCAECRRADFLRFTEVWREAFGVTARRIADEMDAVIHAQRCVSGKGGLSISRNCAAGLPDGAMISAGEAAYAVRGGAFLPWSFGGYGAPSPMRGNLKLLTPRSIAKIFENGYAPGFHASAGL
jgi:hypothetical protein